MNKYYPTALLAVMSVVEALNLDRDVEPEEVAKIGLTVKQILLEKLPPKRKTIHYHIVPHIFRSDPSDLCRVMGFDGHGKWTSASELLTPTAAARRIREMRKQLRKKR